MGSSFQEIDGPGLEALGLAAYYDTEHNQWLIKAGKFMFPAQSRETAILAVWRGVCSEPSPIRLMYSAWERSFMMSTVSQIGISGKLTQKQWEIWLRTEATEKGSGLLVKARKWLLGRGFDFDAIMTSTYGAIPALGPTGSGKIEVDVEFFGVIDSVWHGVVVVYDASEQEAPRSVQMTKEDRSMVMVVEAAQDGGADRLAVAASIAQKYDIIPAVY